MQSTRFLIIHATPASGPTLIGEVQVDEAGILTLLGANPEQVVYLEGWVSRLNAQEDVMVRVPPPAGGDAPMLSSHGRHVSRGQPEFLEALKAHVRRLHGISLMTQAEWDDAQDLDKQGLSLP